MSELPDQPDFSVPTLVFYTATASGLINVPSVAETTLVDVDGTGKMVRASIVMMDSETETRFYLDEVLVDRASFFAWGILTGTHAYTYGCSAKTPQVQLLKYRWRGLTHITVTVPFTFRQNFQIRIYQTTGVAVGVYASAILGLIL